MEETYTFSRALHMMRYGGKKMRPEFWQSGCYVWLVANQILSIRCDMYDKVLHLSSEDIMGSWVEVK